MRQFKDANGESVSFEDICNFINSDYEYEVFIGTDSQVHKDIKKVLYATCIVLYKKGKGGRIFISRDPARLTASLRQRLMNETWRSLEVAFVLSKHLPPNAELIIHIDVNKKKKYKSSNYYQELVGMVTGQGFKCKIKPEAWAAQSVADKFSK
jgi:predicted RNase H-related nuclease YkuK (DUF458 family)